MPLLWHTWAGTSCEVPVPALALWTAQLECSNNSNKSKKNKNNDRRRSISGTRYGAAAAVDRPIHIKYRIQNTKYEIQNTKSPSMNAAIAHIE